LECYYLKQFSLPHFTDYPLREVRLAIALSL
jgi:hypothetical protein